MTEYRPIDDTFSERDRAETRRVEREERERMNRQRGRKMLMTGLLGLAVIGGAALFFTSEANKPAELQTAALEAPEVPTFTPGPAPDIPPPPIPVPEIPDFAPKAAQQPAAARTAPAPRSAPEPAFEPSVAPVIPADAPSVPADIPDAPPMPNP